MITLILITSAVALAGILVLHLPVRSQRQQVHLELEAEEERLHALEVEYAEVAQQILRSKRRLHQLRDELHRLNQKAR